jgi:ABC-type Fe3+/spermidine/putrescine transport system ATPase subunit
VVQPEVLLLDEPLANLDAKLRLELREEVRRIAKKLSITTIYVTHDQEEAFAVADRIAVMNAGKLLQVGRPEEIYHKPANFSVANFVGRSNVLRRRVVEAQVNSLSGQVADLDRKIDQLTQQLNAVVAEANNAKTTAFAGTAVALIFAILAVALALRRGKTKT